jgi:D-alanine-D-alanine ligase
MTDYDYDVLILYRPFPLLTETQIIDVGAPDESVQAVEKALRAAGFQTQTWLVGDDVDGLLRKLDPYRTVIFNYCDGFDENQCGYDPITRTFEELRLAYTGADDAILAGSVDKAISKQQLTAHGVSTPAYKIYENDHVDGWRIFPAIVKPAHSHGSIGIVPESVVRTPQELHCQIQRILDEMRQPALVEDFIDGDEFRVSVWGNYTLEVLPLVRFKYLTGAEREFGFKDYDTKWEERGLELEIPAQISDTLRERIETTARQAFRAVGMRDFGGIDIRVRDETPYVIDPNQNPDISDSSNFLRAASSVGMNYSDLLSGIVRLAAERRPG